MEFSLFFVAQMNPNQFPNGTVNSGSGTHSRSLSQTSFFVKSSLPPLSPLPPGEGSSALSNLNFRTLSMDEIDAGSRGYVSALTSPREHHFHGSNGLPPRKGHRRSNSDVPLGSNMIQPSPHLVPIDSPELLGGRTQRSNKSVGLKRPEMDTNSISKTYAETTLECKQEGAAMEALLDSLMNSCHVDTLNASGPCDKKDTISSSTKMSCGDSSNSESETMSGEGIKRSVIGDTTPQYCHSRSLSMDSGMGSFHIGDLSPKFQSPMGNLADRPSPTDSMNGNMDKISLDFEQLKFNEFELQKILADERLAEISKSDPKRVKRILANRQSAARSKERKVHYIIELESKVKTLQTEVTTLASQMTHLQKDCGELANQNRELKFRIQAMEEQSQLRDDLHEALLAEVQRLKLANMGIRDSQPYLPGKHQMVLPHRLQLPQQIQQLPITTTRTPTTASAALTSA